MKRKDMLIGAGIAMSLAVFASGTAISAGPDKYTVKVPGGLAFSEFKGYESWQVIAVSHNGDKLAAILGNPVMIDAYKAGIPGNGKPFPDGAKMAKIHWNPKKLETFPAATVPGTVVSGKYWFFFGFQWIFAILAPSGKGLPLPGMPAR